MDGFFVIFLINAVAIVIIILFRYIGKKNIKKLKPTYDHPKSNPEDYLNDTTDPRNILHPSNPAGPNYFGKHFNRDD
ncbi:MAG: hypothetical protein VR65_04675 [Desulfobulbaceae bacterium BRH_c16a]|nr:MAG: hypothetical protein VR65_04090 [Desulfobulbaceae bacterium BRH_c16a]KJS02733.1 MAG: hypothetical protein VR65_04675 [Desulfobulbaceae bacterium BRH_c16a]